MIRLEKTDVPAGHIQKEDSLWIVGYLKSENI